MSGMLGSENKCIGPKHFEACMSSGRVRESLLELDDLWGVPS
jgi:hypothetical protein